MIMRNFGALDRDVSALVMGTMNMGATLDEAQSFDILDAYAQMGGNFIDTARVYGAFSPAGMGAAEKVIGRWMAARGNRDKITIATKGAHPPVNDKSVGRLDKQSIVSDLSASLEALGIDSIDLYWLHRDDVRCPVEDILTTLNELIEKKLIRAIGASNWTAERFSQARSVAFDKGLTGFCANQPLWSLAHEDEVEDKTLVQMDHKLYAWHQESRMAVMPYTSQAKGFFQKMEAGGADGLSGAARDRYLTEHNRKIFDAAKAVGQEAGLSAGAVALAFLTGTEAFDVYPIVGVSSLQQMASLREAADAKLTGKQMKALTDLTGLTCCG